MDEPFAALDAQTRAMMQDYLLEIWTRIPKTVLFITHDIDEALLLADRIAVMGTNPGTIIANLPVDLPRPRPGCLSSSRLPRAQTPMRGALSRANAGGILTCARRLKRDRLR
jgi:ABC-type nitrate/sulfonate/bicarbonate transport system ATPase subunit